jgi:hypothetical protein
MKGAGFRLLLFLSDTLGYDWLGFRGLLVSQPCMDVPSSIAIWFYDEVTEATPFIFRLVAQQLMPTVDDFGLSAVPLVVIRAFNDSVESNVSHV